MSGFGGVNQQGTIPLSSGSFALPVAFGYYPTEGSRIASAQYNFAEQVQYYEDLSFLKQQGMETAVQSVWIDNSNNVNAAQITVVGSNQVIIAPPNSQGIIPAFFTEGPGFFITSSAPGITKMILLNVPCHAANFWSVNSATLALNAEGIQTPKLIGTKAFTVSANAAGS